jgi:hypothetical protein
LKILEAMAYGICAGLASGVFDICSVWGMGIIRYKENNVSVGTSEPISKTVVNVRYNPYIG